MPKSKVYICPNGIDDTSTNPETHLFPKEKPVKILFLSNLIESKGVYVLLDACSILQKNGINFECDFIGTEGDLNISQFTNKVILNKLTSRVKYLGERFGKDKQDVYSTAEIFVLPTYYSKECFPLVLLEAMCEGLPVISTYEGGICDIVENGVTGFLVQQKNAEALAEKLEVLITDPDLRQQLGKAGRQKYEQEFTLTKFELRLKEILQQVIIAG